MFMKNEGKFNGYTSSGSIANGRVSDLNSNSNIKNIEGFKKDINEPTSNLSNKLLGLSTQSNTLSRLFFSVDNIKNIQNQIRYNVYKSSKKKHIIGIQNYGEIEIIMRGVYLQYSPNLKSLYTKQIEYLNNIVIKWCIPKIIGEILQYNKYIDDIQSMPVPINRPVNMSNTGMKNLRSVTDIF